ncbi:MAG: efflux RND transporter permease subunit, partial [Pseudomonadota bacterium]
LPFGLPVMIATFGLVGASLAAFTLLKPEMFPLSERGEVLIYMDMPKGASIAETERQARAVQAWLGDPERNPEVTSVTAFVGDGGPRFYLSLDPETPDPAIAFIVADTAGAEEAKALAARARETFRLEFPAARFRVTRLAAGGSESGVVEVEISGPDAETLLAASRRVEAAFERAPGLVRNETDWGNKVVTVEVDVAQDKAREFGVTSEDISEVMQAYFSGARYSTFREGDEQIPIVLRAQETYRDSLEDFLDLSLAAKGELISIDQVATFKPRLEFSEIRRMNQAREVTISAKSETLSAQDLAALIQPTLDGLSLGPAYQISIAGELEDSEEVYAKIGANLPIALMVMLAALVFQFNSFRRAMVTALTIPIVAVGAPFAMIAAGHPMSFFAVLGLMSLMGIIINNAIVLINQIDINTETMALDAAVVTAATQRARPIVLTSLTTILGLIPMALNGGVLFEPMATIMIGGLAVASPLTLLFVPSVTYLLLRARRSAAAA